MSRLSNHPRRSRTELPLLTRIRVLVTVAALSLGLAACGGSSSAPRATGSASASAAATPSAASRPLFGVLEARRCKAIEPAACENPVSPRHDTAAIAALDGFAVTKTTFTPRGIPNIGNAGAVLDLEGQIAAGGLYFIDGAGVVRRLEPGGAVKQVATFAITSPQQTASFAVSPDGTHLMGTVFTFPNNSPSSDPNEPFGHFSGKFRLQLEVATAGGSTSVVKTWESAINQSPDGPGGFTNFVLAGWDAQGPIAHIHTATGTQNAWLDFQRRFSGNLARLHADGSFGPVIGPADCLPYWRPVAGRFVCTKVATNQAETPVSVVGLDGSVVWSGIQPGTVNGLTGGFALSPDGTRLAMEGQVVTLASGAIVRLPPNFTPEGWLSTDTIIGLIPAPQTAGTLGIVHTQDSQHAESWGFSGAFVGILQGSDQAPL